MAIGAFLNPPADLFRRRAFSVPAPAFPASRVPAGPPVSGYGGFGAVAGPVLRALTAHRAQHTPVAGLPVPVPPPDAVLRSGAPETTGATGTTGAWEAVPALGLDPVLRRDAPQGELPGLPEPGIASGFGLIGGGVRALGAPGLGLDYWNDPWMRYAMSVSNDPWTRYAMFVSSRAPFVPPTWPRLGRVV